LIKVKDLTFYYYNKNEPALKDINIIIRDGEFVLISGPSGSGKSTLARSFTGIIPHFYGGKISGRVQVQGFDVFKEKTRTIAEKVGMIFQNPENQLFSSDVEREIAFGLENLNFPINVIKKRIEETLDAIRIAHLRKRSITNLSGGEKQKVAIASVLAMHPEVLILDEPTSELDPKSAEEVLTLIQKLNDELGLTIILIEHRLDRVIQFVDRIIIMDKGKIIRDGPPRKVFSENLVHIGIHIPPIIRICNDLKDLNILVENIPLTVRESRESLSTILNNLILKSSFQNHFKQTFSEYLQKFEKNPPLVEFKNVSFSYEPNNRVLKDINLKIYEGEFISIIGRNGSGKTTLLKHINGLLRPQKGKVIINGIDTRKKSVAQLARMVGFIFQNPSIQFYQDTLEEELIFGLKNFNYEDDDIPGLVEEMLKKFDLEKYRTTYPRYLSIGEQQKAALASVLITNPKIIVLDEPTHGMDYKQKTIFLDYLNNYRKKGNSVILVTHDVESIAEYSDRVVLLSEGAIIIDDLKRNILSQALLFSPQINRLVQAFKHLPQQILTSYELIELIKNEKK